VTFTTRNAATASPLQRRRTSPSHMTRPAGASALDGRVAQLMRMQQGIGNQAVVRMLGSAQAGGRHAIQRKKTTKPGDAELIGLVGDAAENSVIDGLQSDSEKGAAVWNHLKKEYSECLNKGTGYWNDLDEMVSKYKENSTKGDVVSKLSNKRVGYDAKFQSNYSNTVTALGGTEYQVNTEGYDPSSKPKPTVGTGSSDGDYVNSFDIASGKITAAWNFGKSDKAVMANKGLNNSEILWDQYKLAAQEHYKHDSDKDDKVKQALKNISSMVRKTVINETTNAVMYMSYSDSQNWKRENLTLTPGDEEFKALLGTPNCKSAAFMLKDHVDELEKTLDTIQVVKGHSIDIKFKDM